MPSKKPSASKPPEQLTFFIDRSLGVEPIRSVLEAAGLHIEIHRDHFEHDTPDPVWLTVVAGRDWVVLTKDRRIRYRPLELRALHDSHARAFVLVAGNLKGVDIAEAFLNAVPAMLQTVSDIAAPFLATVTKSGKVSIRYPAPEST